MSTRPPRAFDALTPRGRQLRLRSLALDALGRYDLEVRSCSFVSTGFNTVFRVDATNGAAYALRVSPSLRIHAEGCEEVEAAWVAALHRDAGLAVPEVIPARDGSVLVWVTAAGVPGPRSCVLFDWVRGRPLRDRMRAELFRKTGALSARAHEHGARYLSEPPAGALVADRVLYFRVEQRLEELRPSYGSLLIDAVDRAQQCLDELWRDPPHHPHLLHGDVAPGNVMVAGAEPVLIDFQDLIWGFEIQDVVITCLAIEYHGDAALADAFRLGYEAVRTWPDADPAVLAALRAARHLNILNYGLSMRGPGVDAFIERHAEPVAAWMGSGRRA